MNNPGTILLAAGDASRLADTRRVLESAGYTLWTAQSGALALELAHTHLPELVLLDENLPDLSGVEVCRQIKADPELKWTFVIMLCAVYADGDSQSHGLEQEADGYITLPVNDRELAARARSSLRIKHAEDDLRRREGETRSLYQAMTEMFALHELVQDASGSAVDYRVLDCNPAFERLTGFTRQKAIGALASQLYGTGKAPFLDRYAQVAQTGVPFTFEAEFAPMGKWFHISVFSPERGRFATITADVTPYENELARTQGLLQQVEQSRRALVSILEDRRLAEEALKESEARFRALIDQAPVGINLSRNGKSLYANPELLQIFGLREEEAAGLPLVAYFAAPHQDESLERTRRYSLGLPTPPVFESVCQRKDGTEFPVHVRTTSVELADGLAVLAFITDITERKRAEEALKEYNTRLEAAVEERTRELRQAHEQLVRQEKLATLGQLAGGVGHELRNPLGVINTSVYYLKLVQPDADEKIKQYHRMIEQQVQIAGMIISDLLDFARLPTADRQPVSLPDLLQRVLTRFPVPPSVQVVRRLPADLPELFVDPLHLEQVFGNLITNACQAMHDEGRLSISARRERGWIAIAVKDTGAGITPENMQKLFEPLFTTKVKGIGLGLAVSKKLVEANGGRIEAASRPGQGATFTLHLPVKEGSE
jgi:PAS domain S-box-containing protein